MSLKVIDSKPTIVSDISLSHGISGIIVVLTKILECGIATVTLPDIIYSAVKYVIHQKYEQPKGSLYPNLSLESEARSTFSRLAWCYGDIGIANMLHKVNQHLPNSTYRQEINQILSYTGKRLSQESTLYDGYAICHGISGILYILYKFKYVYKYDAISETTVQYWSIILYSELSEKTVQQMTIDNVQTGWGLLQGISGIGMVLLSLKYGYFDWDECLLLK